MYAIAPDFVTAILGDDGRLMNLMWKYSAMKVFRSANNALTPAKPARDTKVRRSLSFAI